MRISEKSLSKKLQSFYGMEIMQNPSLTLDEKELLVKNHGPDAKEWVAPKDVNGREFTL
jgi:hypothetical protein